MALNYSFSPGTLPLSERTAVFATGTTPRSISTFLNGSDLYIAIANDGGNNIHLHKVTASSFSGTIAASSRLATFTTGSSPRWVKVFVDGTTLYVASADYNSNLISFFRTDLNASTTTLTASFATPNRPYGLDFYISGTTGYLVSFNDTSGNCSFFRFDPTTVSTTAIAANATLTAGSGVRSGRLIHSGGTVYIVVANSTSGTASFFRITTPGSVTGTVAATATLTSSTGSQDVCMVLDGSTTAYIANAVYNNSTTYFYRLNPTTVSGTVASTATFTNGRGASSANINLLSSTSAILTIASFDADTVTQCFFNPSTLSTTVSTTSRLYATGTPVYYSELIISGSTTYLISVERTSQTASFWRGDLNSVAAALATTSAQKISNTSPIQKTSGGTLTLSSSIDYFIAYLLLSLGSQLTASGISTTVYGWSFTATSDTEGTLNEDFIYSGATAEITGNYRLTMGVSRTLTLGTKSSYNDSITIPSTGILIITANTTVTSEFILSAGTTVNKSGSGPYTLTIPYQDPGLVLGSGVVLSAPQITVTAANFADGVRVQVSHRQVFTISSTAINTGTDVVTLGNDSNGDAANFRTTSPNTLIRFSLASGATIPTSSPQIIDGGLYYWKSGGQLSITEGGAVINFSTQGSGNFVLTAETEKDNSIVSGGSGYSYAFSLSDLSRVRVKASHYSVSGGIANCSSFFDEVYAWSDVSGVTILDVVNNAVAASQDSIHEQLVDITSVQLEGPVVNASGTSITSITLPDDGSTVSGLSLALEGVGRIQINANDVDGVISWQEMYLWGCYIRSTEAGIRLASSTTFTANSIYNFVFSNLEFDNTSSTPLQIVGGIGRSSDGSSPVSNATTGSIVVNAVSQGTGAVITTGGSALTTTEHDWLEDATFQINELHKRQGLQTGITASEKDAATGTPGFLTTSDGLIDQTITKNVDGSVTINRN